MRSDRSQFEWIVVRHLDAAYNVARWYVRNDQDAEDVVQDSVLAAFHGFAKFRGADGKPWLLRIVRNHCLRRLERNRRFPQEPLNEDLMGTFSYSDLGDPEAKLLRSVDAALVREAVDRLPDVYREVIVLREFEEMSYAEIAEIVELPVGTVMSRLARGRAQLADDLRRQGAERR